MAAHLFDRTVNAWVEVPDDRVDEFVAQGTHGFETGIQIPVVSPDGKLGSMPAEDAERAFAKHGYRWQRPSDRQAWEERSQREIQAEHYGDAGGVVRTAAAEALGAATFGASDVIMSGAAELLGEGDAVRAGRQAQREENPIAAVGGMIGGVLVNPLAPKIVAGSKALGGLLKWELAGGKAAGTVGKLVQGAAEKGLGGAVEGAFFGFGQGVTEAALGNPAEVSENLVSGTMEGMLWGGALGPVFGAAGALAPKFNQVVGKAADKFADVSSDVARKGAEKAVTAVLTMSGQKELVPLVKGLTARGSLAVREAYINGGREAAEAAAKEIGTLEQEAAAFMKANKADLNALLKRIPRERRAEIETLIRDSAGDLTKTLDTLKAAVGGADVELDTVIAELAGMPSQTHMGMVDDVGDVVRRLEAIGTPTARARARELKEYFASQTSARGYKSDAGAWVFDQRDELEVARELRKTLENVVGKVENAQEKKTLTTFAKQLSERMYANPSVGDAVRNRDKFRATYDTMRRAVTGIGKESGMTVSEKMMGKIAKDPEMRERFSAFAANFSKLGHEIEAVHTAKTIAQKDEALTVLMGKAREIQGDRAVQNLAIEDWAQLAEVFGSPGMMKRASALRELSEAMAMSDDGALSKAIQLQRALGKDVSEEFTGLLKHEEAFAALRKLEGVSGDGSLTRLQQVFGKLGRIGGTTAGALKGGPLGAWVGGEAGQKVGEKLGGAGGALNPIRALEMLSKVERAAQKNAQRITKMTGSAVDALTSDKGRVAAITVVTRDSMEARREDFAKVRAHMRNMADLEKRTDYVSRVTESLEDAPNLQMALSMQLTKTFDFIAMKMPTDPFEGRGLNGLNTDWTPSDFELAKFGRYLDAVADPGVVMARIVQGSVSPEEIETLETVHPVAYNRLREGVLNAIMEPNVKLSYSQRIQIGTLLNIPADVTLEPAFISAMQANYAIDRGGRPEGGAPPPQGGPGTGSKPIPRPANLNIDSEAMSTNVQRITDK